MTTNDDVIEAINLLRVAVAQAREKGRAGLAVLFVDDASKSGEIVFKLDGQFVDDLAAMLELPPLSEDETEELGAAIFLDALNLMPHRNAGGSTT